MIKYQVITDHNDLDIVIKTNEDGSITSFIKDESNPDYQAYLRWLENPDG